MTRAVRVGARILTRSLFAALTVAALAAPGCVRAGFDGARTDGAPASEGPLQDIASPDLIGQLPAGTRDPSFGAKGLVMLSVNKTQIDQAKEVALDASGRIVVGGQLWTTSRSNDFFVARFLASGAVDTSLNGKGFVRAGSDQNDILGGMTIDGQGRIVCGGESYTAGVKDELTLARFTPAGKPDGSFGAKGIATLAYGIHDDHITRVIVDGKDRIVFSGWSETASKGPKRFLVGRVTDSGAKDPSFSATGITAAALAGMSSSARAVGLDSAGRVIAAGWVWTNASAENDVAVARFLTNGTLDASFGSGGEVRVAVGSEDDHAWGLTVDASGRILVVGRSASAATGRLFVLRLRGDGSPDPAFGDKGIYLLDASLDAIGTAISVDSAGRVVAAGSAKGAGDLDVLVVRLDKDGKPDPTLDGKGHVLIDLGRDEDVRGATLDAAGRLLVTGWQDSDPTTDSFLLRIWM